MLGNAGHWSLHGPLACGGIVGITALLLRYQVSGIFPQVVSMETKVVLMDTRRCVNTWHTWCHYPRMGLTTRFLLWLRPGPDALHLSLSSDMMPGIETAFNPLASTSWPATSLSWLLTLLNIVMVMVAKTEMIYLSLFQLFNWAWNVCRISSPSN